MVVHPLLEEGLGHFFIHLCLGFVICFVILVIKYCVTTDVCFF